MTTMTIPAAIDPQSFRNALSRFASGVTIVTTQDGRGRPVGFTASSFASLSLDPPLILVCLARNAECYPAFAEAPSFAVSILASGQADLARRFATKGIEKFDGLPICRAEGTGLPLIPGAIARLQCRMRDRFDGGDHIILVGEVVGAETQDGAPVIYLNRQYGRFVADETSPSTRVAGATVS